MIDENLVAQIYECAFVPDKWPNILDKMAESTRSRVGYLAIWDEIFSSVIANAKESEDFLQPLFSSRIPQNSIRMENLKAYNHPGFRREIDVYAGDSYRDDPFYKDFIYPRGLGWVAGTHLNLPTGEQIVFSLERTYDLGPVEAEHLPRLDAYRPHLARAVTMGLQLKMTAARSIVAAMAMFGAPALVCNAQGKVIAANDLIQSQKAYVHWRASDHLGFKDKEAGRLFARALEGIFARQDRGVLSFPVRGDPETDAMVAHIAPVRLQARDIFTGGAAVLILTSATAPKAPPVELVQSLFDLTPAEARMARDLAGGLTVDDMATKGGVSINTVRTHVRRVLEKTGCNRQADVVALLAGLSPLRA